MLASLTIVLPVFGLIGLGYLARRVGLIGDKVGEGLSEFVFALAVPCLILRTLARAQVPETQPWGYWLAYFAGVAVAWGFAMLLARKFFGTTGTVSVVVGFAAGQANTVLVGVPMILKAYGDEGAVPLFLLIAVHLPVTMTMATLMAEGRRASALVLARRLATHPIVVGVLLGWGIQASALPLPAPLWQVIDLLAGAAVPCALIAMGAALRRYGIGAEWRLSALIAALKLGLHPLVVFVLATEVFTMPRAWAGVAVLFAACPCGINAYLFAQRYGAGVGVASSAVALSTVLSLVTIVVWLQVLGVG